MTELKHCPFCGGHVRFNHNAELIPDGIFCQNCHMLMRFTTIHAGRNEKFEAVMERLAAAWNMRVGDSDETD